MAHDAVMSMVVAVVGSRVEAELIAGMLQGHGVKASVSSDDAGGMELPLQAQGVRVLVPDAKAAEARRLLDSMSLRRSRPPKTNRFQRWIVRVLGGGEAGS